MAFRPPSAADIQELGKKLEFNLDAEQAERMLAFMGPFSASCEILDNEPDTLPALKYPERTHYFPDAAENNYGAWYVKSRIEGAASGPLKGRSVAIKDNIFVAGIPMMAGASVLEGFVPDFDATVVTRLLDAGASIAGKAVCEYFCTSSANFTGSGYPVDNPRKTGYSTGGSSSGSGALVAAGEVDIALGCDQAGSVRIPSSWCGIYGMKPTHGLVPYTGIMGMEATIDHVGPMTANVADNALALDVMAGYDDIDGRQRRLQLHNYSTALGKDVAGMKIGIVEEGFGMPYSDNEVDECVRAAAANFAELGVSVEPVSIPVHPQGIAVWSTIFTDGFRETLKFNGMPTNIDTASSPALWQAANGWLKRMDEMPPNVQIMVLFGQYLERYNGYYYGKAKNMMRRLAAAYNNALANYDLLLMPTTSGKPLANVASLAEASIEEVMEQTLNAIFNTCQFDATGHPAMSIPCGEREGLPIGMMLVGKHFDEPGIYRAAHAFEQSFDWLSL
ncbi:MAG: amidase [Gammaproteobacteria bacterium]|nr:amidase [Gammaproteobacteria bacterium]